MDKRPSGSRKSEPDAFLMLQPGVAYRYHLLLAEPEVTADVLRILKELSISLRYLLLLPDGSGECYEAYVGLGSPDVLDLPFRFAAAGVQTRRGEEIRTKGR